MEIYNSTTQPPPFVITERPPFFQWSNPVWFIFIGSRCIMIGFVGSCMIAWALIGFSLWLGTRLGWCSKSTLKEFLSICAEKPKSKAEFESFKASLEKADKSQDKPELQQTYQSNLTAAPLKSNMTWLKGPKVDQLPNLFTTAKTVGTLEELLIMP